MYTYRIDGVEIEAGDRAMAASQGLLDSALCMAAALSFQKSRPVVVHLNGQPYRVVSVDFVNSTTKPPPTNAI